MASNYGVNTTVGSNAPRSINIQSTTPIGIVGTVVLPGTAGGLDSTTYNTINENATSLLFFGSASSALSFFGSLAGTIREALVGIDDQNASCPIIISAIKITTAQNGYSAESFYNNDATVKSNIINAVNALKNSYALFGYKPNIIIAPRFSHDTAISAPMISVADRLLALAIVDLNATSESDAVTKRGSFGTRRALLRDSYVNVWDTLTNSVVSAPQSPHIAGMIAWVDGQWEYGWADSFSNRVINGITGSVRNVEFVAGADCEADRLRTQNIGTVIRYNGFRAWGGETTDIDPTWQDHTRVRVFDRISEAALNGLFWAIDRRADILKSAKDSVEQLLLALKGSKVLVGFDVWWDSDKNTKANITAGKFYLATQEQNTPIVKRFEISFNYADRWGDTLIKMIS